MLHRVALVRTEVSEEITAYTIRVTRICELGTSAVTVFLQNLLRLLVTAKVVSSSPILDTLMMVEIRSSETSILSRARRRNIPEDGTLQKLTYSIIVLIVFTASTGCNWN
jgi:hypothetical protein